MNRFIKFCLVGVTNTIITFVTFYVLSEILGLNYLFSSFTGYVVGIINSFVLNKKWTFKDNNNRVIYQFIKFSALNSISLGVNLLVLYTCVEKLYISKVISQIIAIGFSTIINYIGSKILVFEKHNEETILEISTRKD